MVREGEREGEKHQSAASHTPRTGGTEPTTQAHALIRNPGIQESISNPSPCRTTPNQLSHTGQGLN